METTATDKPLLRLASMARRLRVPSTWLRAEALAGRVPYLPAGTVLLFHPPTVERVLAERAATGTTEVKP